jgi:hypothetical protein
MIAHHQLVLAAPVTQKRTTPDSGVCSLPALANTHWALKSPAMIRRSNSIKGSSKTFDYPSKPSWAASGLRKAGGFRPVAQAYLCN